MLTAGQELLRVEWTVDLPGNCQQMCYAPQMHDPEFHA